MAYSVADLLMCDHANPFACNNWTKLKGILTASPNSLVIQCLRHLVIQSGFGMKFGSKSILP